MPNSENNDSGTGILKFIFVAGLAALNLFFFTEDILQTIENPIITSLNLAAALFLSILAIKIKI